jgi:hypothetical protein
MDDAGAINRNKTYKKIRGAKSRTIAPQFLSKNRGKIQI